MEKLRFRLADPAEYPALRNLILESFAPITWFRQLDEQFGPLNGLDWRARWQRRLDDVFRTQIILVGESGGVILAAATGTADVASSLGFIDLLAVDIRHQGGGIGRQMLEGMLAHFRSLGMEHANLECLSGNERANRLYLSAGWTLVTSSHKWFIRL
ncbi:MAG: GNAT family N-acetyltransferase [Acidimicrobiia bacterium]|nr:GNAT family N-acetyltransferase [Acidimicrobiia bacterium]